MTWKNIGHDVRDSNGELIATATSHANSSLIAAAPELLDFARNIAGLDDRHLNDVKVIREWRDDARAAIAKTTGDTDG